MKIFAAISRLIIGSLFIVSGLIKCNDAIGFSYKLNDYFAEGVLNLEFLIPYSLGLAVMICVVEVVLGVAVIFGLKSKLSSILILLMMLFFTWLTWYTSSCLVDQEEAGKLGLEFTKNCVTDCGCFGDALKLEPKESFYKDLFLLIFTIPLFFFAMTGKIPKNKPKEDLLYIGVSLLLILGFGVFKIGWWFTFIFSLVLYVLVYFLKNKTKSQWLILTLVYLVTLGFTYYCLQNLPIKDFRPFKVGNNIIEKSTVPLDAPKDIYEYTWTFNENGVEKQYITNGSYPESSGEYISGVSKLISKGYEPPIHDFSIEKDGEDFTEDFLTRPNVIMFVSYNLSKAESEGLRAIKEASDKAILNGYDVIGMTASGPDEIENVIKNYNLNFEYYTCDETALKTIVRSNPGILKLEKGTIIQKVHWNDVDELELPKVERPEPKVDLRDINQGEVYYLIDGKESTLEEVQALDKDRYELAPIGIDGSFEKYLDSINTAKNKIYVGVSNLVLKKE